jgi:simple sugar transport system substrate-binding protein
MRRLLAALALALVAALIGCGGTTTVREPDLVVRGDDAVPARPSADAAPERGRGLRVAAARIAVVSHGQASDSFWSIVKKGVDDAGDQTGVAVSYRAPDKYSVDRMRRLIDEAIADRLDGLVVSLPDVEALAPAIRRAERAGIPVVSINSGSDRFRELGILAHVGQPEWRAGFESGRRMARSGIRNALCVNQEVGNAGLKLRCQGFGAGMRRSGGRTHTIGVELQDSGRAQRRIAQEISTGAFDGILTLGPGGAEPALAALNASGLGGQVRLATFDLSPAVLQALQAGRLLFAVDQQPYLQGYLPIVLLAERARHQLFPAGGELIPTGPDFLTPAMAANVIELSRRGYR